MSTVASITLSGRLSAALTYPRPRDDDGCKVRAERARERLSVQAPPALAVVADNVCAFAARAAAAAAATAVAAPATAASGMAAEAASVTTVLVDKLTHAAAVAVVPPALAELAAAHKRASRGGGRSDSSGGAVRAAARALRTAAPWVPLDDGRTLVAPQRLDFDALDDDADSFAGRKPPDRESVE